ncbi:hypothetical protein LEMLEM_LOCUS5855 [Lemmus lemmus]
MRIPGCPDGVCDLVFKCVQLLWEPDDRETEMGKDSRKGHCDVTVLHDIMSDSDLFLCCHLFWHQKQNLVPALGQLSTHGIRMNKDIKLCNDCGIMDGRTGSQSLVFSDDQTPLITSAQFTNLMGSGLTMPSRGRTPLDCKERPESRRPDSAEEVPAPHALGILAPSTPCPQTRWHHCPYLPGDRV